MPFEAGKTPEGAKPFQPGKSGNPSGKLPGTKNRSTIARKVLEMRALFADEMFDKLQQQYPEITKQMTVEEIGTVVQAHKMISEGDTNAYKALHDSAYGAPKQETETTINGGFNVHLSKDEIKSIAKDLEDSV